MPVLSEQILPATPGTIFVQFKFFPYPKASLHAIVEKMTRRPVIGWVLEGERRPMPVVVGLPIVNDPEADGCEAVVVPHTGLLIDCLTGQAWGSDEAFSSHVAARWGGWLKANAPAPTPAPQSAVVGTVMSRSGGFALGDVAA